MTQRGSSSTARKRTSHLSQQRHSSNLSGSLASPPLAARAQKDITIHKFLLSARASSDNFDLPAALDAYDAVKACDALGFLQVAETLSFAEKVATMSEDYYDRDLGSIALCLYGQRLRVVLEDLKPRIAELSPYDQRRRSLLARAAALVGDLEQAKSLISELQAMPVDDQVENSILHANEGLIRATRRYFDSTRVLDFLIEEWNSVGPYLMPRSGKWYKPEVAYRIRSFRRAAYSILEIINKPAAVLAARQEWDQERRQRMGQLLIEVLCDRDLSHDAFSVLQEMQNQDLTVPVDLQLTLVRALAKSGAFELGNTLFATLTKTIPSGSRYKFFLSTGLYLFARQGNVARAEEYYGYLEERKTVSEADIAMMLHAHAFHGKTESVTHLFHQVFRDRFDRPELSIAPNKVHYTIVIFAFAQRGDFEGMNTWLEAMSKAGFPPDAYVYSIILKSFAKRGDVGSVGAVLDQMRKAGVQPNLISYTTVVALLAKRKDPVAAEAIYKRAIQEGIFPDRRMITSLMNAHVEAGSWQGVIRVFDYLSMNPSRQLRLSVEVYNTLLKAYVLIGAPFRMVSSLFDKLQEIGVRPDAYSFALLIQSACDAGLMDVASDIFLEMDKLADHWQSNLHINTYILTIIMSGFLRHGDKRRAKAVYDEMQQRGIHPTAVTFNAILTAYANEKSEESIAVAEEFLNSLMDANPNEHDWAKPVDGRGSALEHVYRPLMAVYARQSKPEEVERLFQDMLDKGGKPSLGVLTSLLDAYRRAADIGAVLQVWPQIYELALRHSRVDSLFDNQSDSTDAALRRQGNLLCIPLSIYVDALSAAGKHAEIAEVWKTLQDDGFAFDSHNWNHLAVALVRAGEPERAFEILERVILPYQRQSEQILRSRNQKPDTPLTFDDNPTHEDDPADESPMHGPKKRAEAVKISSRKLREEFYDDDLQDFAHPLHILYQISPAWNVWRPHMATLSLLVTVLSHLELGMIVQPLKPEDELLPLDVDRDKRRKMRKLASGILGRLHNNYPNAVRAVQDFERLEKLRFGEDYDPYRRSFYATTS
jgi:pentatricopeptide repeat-containing protein PET309